MAEQIKLIDETTTEDKKNIDEAITESIENHDLQLREYPIEVLISKYTTGLEEDQAEIFIPDYQREFIWLPKQQSRFIESIFMNLPIPPLFLGESDEEEREGAWEVIDGTQRLRTLNYFINNQLTLCDLKTIPALNNFKFNNLPLKWQRRFKSKIIRLAVLTTKIDESARREMFDRLNSGGTKLQPMEQRRGHSDGPFLSFIESLAQNQTFREICPLPQKKINLREYEEMILRFFAYNEQAENFNHEVDSFLTSFLKDKNSEIINDESILIKYKQQFEEMINFVSKNFSNGFRKEASHKTVPRVRFEAISIGVSRALQKSKNLHTDSINEWINSPEFKKHTRSDATNSRPKLLERIYFVRDKLLGKEPERIPTGHRADNEWKNLELL